jgi:hypothetical protein
LGIASDTVDFLIKLQAADHLHPRSAIMEIGAKQLSQDFLAHQEKLAQLGSLFGIEQPLVLSPPEPTHFVHCELVQGWRPFVRIGIE